MKRLSQCFPEDEYNKNGTKECNHDELNWRDSGIDEINDPSMNDYLKGYKIDPYEFRYWASKNNINLKTASAEQYDMHFFPQYLADYILTRWNGADGPIQDFYNGFVLRYSNVLKKEIAKILNERGFEVLPVLTDDKPIYANVLTKVSQTRDLNIIFDCVDDLFGTDNFRLFLGEIKDLQENGQTIMDEEALSIMDYYNSIYGNGDMAFEMANLLYNEPDKAIKKFNELSPEYLDKSISDESLKKMEDYLGGNANPYGCNNINGTESYDSISDLRNSDNTVVPVDYEIRLSNSKKKD